MRTKAQFLVAKVTACGIYHIVKCQQVKLSGKHMAYIYDISDFEYQMIYSTLLTYGSHAGSVLIFNLFLGFDTMEFG
jgi:hypothetical protein